MEIVCKTKLKKNKSIDNSKSNAKAKCLLILKKEKTLQNSSFIIILEKEIKLSSYKFLCQRIITYM